MPDATGVEPRPRTRRHQCLRMLEMAALALWLALLPGVPLRDGAAATPAEAQAEAPGESPGPSAASDEVLWARYDGVIGSVAADYLGDALAEAARRGVQCLVIELDTPGGLDGPMRAIIKGMLASPVPVVVYVAPSGARAASAGAFIAMAAQVVAMAPGTNLGAAHPVALGEKADSTMIGKMTNDAAAYIRSLARQRGRNEDWAERAVRESVSADVETALALGVADLQAAGRGELLERLEGRAVAVGDAPRTLAVARARIVEYPMSPRYRFLNLLNDPNVAYLLLMIGFYGIFFELSSPGAVLPGVIGGISMVLGLYALHSLTINYAGLLLMALGLVFFIAEVKAPTHGLLAGGGIVSLTLGSLMLVRSPLPYLRVSLKVILPSVLLTAAFFLFAVGMALRAQKRRPAVGRRSLVGAAGDARTDIAPEGTVFVQGTHWRARAEAAIPAGSRVRVVAIDGLVLTVRRDDGDGKDEG